MVATFTLLILILYSETCMTTRSVFNKLAVRVLHLPITLVPASQQKKVVAPSGYRQAPPQRIAWSGDMQDMIVNALKEHSWAWARVPSARRNRSDQAVNSD